MGEEEWCRNRKFDVTSLGRKLKLYLLIYINRKPARYAENFQ
jgi:hypothetical protein